MVAFLIFFSIITFYDILMISKMEDCSMKKNLLLRKGTSVMGVAIIFRMIFDVLFFILFSNIVGEYGSFLYGYSYFICFLFLGVLQIGVIFSIYHFIDGYNICGYYQAKRKFFYLIKKYLFIVEIFLFLIFFLFAGVISSWIIGNFSDGITVHDLAIILRFSSFSFLIFPLVNIHRGYLLGNKCTKMVIHSMILENIIQFILLIVGSFFAYQILHLSYITALSLASFSISITSCFVYLYLIYQERKYKQIIEKETMKVVEPNIRYQDIVKKFTLILLPFILFGLFFLVTFFIDTRLLMKILVKEFSYLPHQAESVINMIYVWCPSLNFIFLCFLFGIIIRFFPDFFKKLKLLFESPVEEKIHYLLEGTFYFTVPFSFILSILSSSIFTVVYNISEFGASAYACYAFVLPAVLFFLIGIFILAVLKRYREMISYFIVSFILKLIFNISLVYALSHLGFPPYYGFIIATILVYVIFGFLVLHFLQKNYQISYENTIKRGFNILLITFIVVIILLGIQYIFPFSSSSRVFHLLYIIGFILLGNFIYLLISTYSGLISSIFGNCFISVRKK